MSIDAGRFNWFEHLSTDTAAARRFYSEVLAWKIEDAPMPGMTYPMIKLGERTIGGFATLPTGVKTPHWVSYVAVTDLHATVRKAIAAGGKALMDAYEIPGVGRMQPVADPHGAVTIAFQPVDPSQDKLTGPGTFHWNELWSPDPKASLAFYTAAFGYTHSAMEMDGMGTYYVLENDGVHRGGIMKTPVAGIPAHWLPYVDVADLDTTVGRVTRNGGTVEGDAMTVPGVGRFSFIRDPQGARLGLITPAAG
jgi:hypothetical protein